MKRYFPMILSVLLAAGIGSACYILVLQKQITDAAQTGQTAAPRSAGNRPKAVRRERPRVTPAAETASEDTIFFTGFVRGRSMLTLKNKYAGFVTKVHVFSHQRVKQGDVILEYDDLALQTSIRKLEHAIEEQELLLERKKLRLTLTRLDPLPSEYRNLYWKRKIALENLERVANEFEVYEQLHGSKIVTDLAYREKREAFITAEAEVKKMDNDMKILKEGLADLYIKSAEAEVKETEAKLKHLKDELALLRQEEKYYKITAPYDGLCITNSDSVGQYDASATAAAEVHRDDEKRVYAYCPERYIRHVREGETYRFVSNQYPDEKQGFELLCFEIKKTRYDYGNESYFLVKLKVVKEPHPLRIGSIGTLEIDLPPAEPPEEQEPEPDEA